VSRARDFRPWVETGLFVFSLCAHNSREFGSFPVKTITSFARDITRTRIRVNGVRSIMPNFKRDLKPKKTVTASGLSLQGSQVRVRFIIINTVRTRADLLMLYLHG